MWESLFPNGIRDHEGGLSPSMRLLQTISLLILLKLLSTFFLLFGYTIILQKKGQKGRKITVRERVNHLHMVKKKTRHLTGLFLKFYKI
jgi:hypothetical protein